MLPNSLPAPKLNKVRIAKIMTFKRTQIVILLLLLGAFLSSCGLLLEFENLRHQEPSQYYLFAPPNYTGEDRWPAFIAIGGFGQTGRDCLRTWMQYAEENKFILICPVLAEANGSWLQFEGEEAISAILGAVSQEYKIFSKSFLVGFSSGAQFVIGYTFRFPGFVSAASVISTGNVYPLYNSSANRVPFLITVGEQDPNRIDLARDFHTLLSRSGYNSTFYIIEETGHEISPTAIDLTLQLFHQVNP